MNNNGQTLILKFMIAITIIVVVLAMSPLLSEVNVDARDSSNLDCDNESISDFNKLGCLASDSSLFLMVATALGIALALFGIQRFRLK